MGSSQTRARIRVPCISRQILNHCATREALEWDLDEGIDACWAERWGRGGLQAVARHTQTQGVSELNIFPKELCVGLYKGCYNRKTKRTYYIALQDRYTIGNANNYNC